MKKSIIVIALVAFLVAGVPAVQAETTAQLRAQYESLLQLVIKLLAQRIAELQAQLAVLQAKQLGQPVQVAPQEVQTVNPPSYEAGAVSAPQITATSTQSAPQQPQVNPNPSLTLSVNGQEVSEYVALSGTQLKFVWLGRGAGENLDCYINGQSVGADDARTITAVQSFTFGVQCVGRQTAQRIEKSVNVNVETKQ